MVNWYIVLSCDVCHKPETDCCTDKQCRANGIVWHGMSVVYCVSHNVSCMPLSQQCSVTCTHVLWCHMQYV